METMLDELIRHCEEVAEKNEKFCDKKRGDEYRQLAEWLKDYKQSLEREFCEDAISRQAAIDAMYALCDTGETIEENPWRDNPYIDAVTDVLDNLPSVTSQPIPKGHGNLKDELDLDLFAPSLGTGVYINDLMAKHNIDYVNGDDEDKVRAFAMDLIHGCMNVIKTAPTIIEAEMIESEEKE